MAWGELRLAAGSLNERRMHRKPDRTLRNIAARISLNASQVGGSQVLLSWNQPGLGLGVAYEIRRCSSFNSPTITCTVVATVQGSSYGVLQGEGVYLVRAIGPLGELQGESNRVQLCCRG